MLPVQRDLSLDMSGFWLVKIFTFLYFNKLCHYLKPFKGVLTDRDAILNPKVSSTFSEDCKKKLSRKFKKRVYQQNVTIKSKNNKCKDLAPYKLA